MSTSLWELSVPLMVDKSLLRPREAETSCLLSLTEQVFCPPLPSVRCHRYVQRRLGKVCLRWSSAGLVAFCCPRKALQMVGLTASCVECLLVAFQPLLRDGQDQFSWQGSRGSEEQNMHLFSQFDHFLVCLYGLYKADPAGFGDTKPVT